MHINIKKQPLQYLLYLSFRVLNELIAIKKIRFTVELLFMDLDINLHVNLTLSLNIIH